MSYRERSCVAGAVLAVAVLAAPGSAGHPRSAVAAATAALANHQPGRAPAVNPGVVARRGMVRTSGRGFVDDDGPFLALGTTLFWGLWGLQHDRERLEKNLETIRAAGFDYVRVLGAVGPGGWSDRTVDPTDAGWQKRVAAFTDLAYDVYGLRTQWTVFGGVEAVPAPADRMKVVERLGAALKGRHDKVFGVEIANEGWQNGFDGLRGRGELKRLAARLRDSYAGLLATTSPPSASCGQQFAYYGDSAATFMTLHFSRNGAANGRRAAVDAPWTATRTRCPGVPEAIASNEPIGPYSSVREERDPLVLTMAAAATWASGVGAYVLHTGAGIRGGGEEDARRGRPANIWEVEGWERIAGGLRCVRSVLPPDLPAWSRREPGSRGHPLAAGRAEGGRAEAGALTVVRERRFVTLLTSVEDRVLPRTRRALTYRAVDPLTCSAAKDSASRGATVDIPGDMRLVIGEVR